MRIDGLPSSYRLMRHSTSHIAANDFAISSSWPSMSCFTNLLHSRQLLAGPLPSQHGFFVGLGIWNPCGAEGSADYLKRSTRATEATMSDCQPFDGCLRQAQRLHHLRGRSEERR